MARTPGRPAQAVWRTWSWLEKTFTSTMPLAETYWAKAAAVAKSSMRNPASTRLSSRDRYSLREIRLPRSVTVRSEKTPLISVAGRRSPAAVSAAERPSPSAATVGDRTSPVLGS